MSRHHNAGPTARADDWDNTVTETETKPSLDFVRSAVEADNTSGRFGGKVVTRFPPEPNGYLHIGHAKSMCLNFGLAQEYGGRCHMRFDDTNPAKEEEEFVDGILEDVRWLGWDWGEHLYFASDHFDKLYDFAIDLINKGKAYVDDLDQEQIRKYRGTLTEPGVESPYRNRSVEENLALFLGMKNGEIDEGQRVLRAKIDMVSGNINMRDPVLYRVLKTPHHRTGDKWVVYPMYDFAHGQSDSVEGVTHSICTMEYEDHRPLYDWLLDALDVYHPQQIEFARLNLSHTVMSKRKLAQLVNEGHVSGWDDPRMPTLAGLRRRGYTPESIRRFCEIVGVAKRQNVIEIALLEHAIRDDLNTRASRVLAVLRPLKVVIENYPEDQVEHLRRGQQPGRTPTREPARCPSPGSCTSSGATSWRTRRRSSSAWPPGARCGCATATSSPAPRWSRTTPVRSSSCAAPTTPRPAADSRPTAGR